jgi:tRNA threonylcarbamoyladenosine modification (KEOPS) complex Cgi121 subunit
MLSRSLDVEIIVYASAQKQIGRAFDTLGVFDGLNEVAVTVVGTSVDSVKEAIQDLINKIGEETNPSFVATTERIDRIKDHFQIEDKELEAITDSDDAKSKLRALSRCLVSRVSLVAFDS